MKKIALLGLMILLCALFAHAATTSAESASLRVSLVNQEPDPAEPGQYVDVRVKVENIGNEAMEGVMIEFVNNYPLYLDPSQNALQNIGTMTAFQKDDRAVIYKFKVKVDEAAVEGTNTLKIRSKSSKTDWQITQFDINIRTIDANIGFEEVSTSPSPVEPGKDATITMKIKNMADSMLKDISLNLDLTKATLGTADLDALPFAPTESGTEKRIWQIKSGDEAVFSFKIRAYPTASSGVYKIPVELTYYDELGTEYTKDDVIGIIVNSEPDLSVILDETDIQHAGQKGEVSFKFINKGLADVKFVDVLIKETPSYEVLSPTEVYIGNIDSDDYESAEYNLFVKPTAEEQLFVPLHYEYMDSNNNKYSKDIELKIKLYNEEKSREFGLEEAKNMNPMVWVILGAIVLFIVWRVWKKVKTCKK